MQNHELDYIQGDGFTILRHEFTFGSSQLTIDVMSSEHGNQFDCHWIGFKPSNHDQLEQQAIAKL
jgi:hypothetical protein